jgi:predicted DCC family thiol-disulfide oxidoreductase YuxK
LETHTDTTPIRMAPYQSEEAKQALGDGSHPGRPNVAFLARPNGEIARGLDAFLALLPGFKGGRVFSVLLNFPLFKPFAHLLYWLVAWYRYSVLGKVPFVGATESIDKLGRETPIRNRSPTRDTISFLYPHIFILCSPSFEGFLPTVGNLR